MALKQTSDHFELMIIAQQLHVSADSSQAGKEGKVQLIIEGFEPNASNSASLNLPIGFEFGQFRSSFLSLLTSHSIPSHVSRVHLLSLFGGSQELVEALGDTYAKMKQESISVVLSKRVDSLQTIKAQDVRQLNAAHQKSIDSLLELVESVDEGSRYGGQLELADLDSSGVTVYTAGRVSKRRVFNRDSIRFYPDRIYIKTFNNFIDVLHVDGILWAGGKRMPVNFYNGDFSIPLKHLYLRNQFLAFRIPFRLSDTSRVGHLDADREGYRTYLVNVSDLIRVNPYRNHYTFMAKNDAYLLTRRDSVQPYQRRTFYDYLNFTTFLDFLGVIEKTPNSLIQIEGRVRLPLRLVNSRFFWEKNYLFRNVFFPKVDAYLNAAFVNGTQTDSRFGTIFNRAVNSTDLDTLFIDNFDLIRRNNIRTGIELGLLKREVKTGNINVYLDYSLNFVRTSLSYTIVNVTEPDIVNRFNVWSYSHGPILRFEYRPDQNIGMDFSFGTNFRQKILNSDNDNLFVFEMHGPINKNRIDKDFVAIREGQKANYKVEFNTYFLLNPSRSNGGLYFRLSNYFNHNWKQMFPQILIGYSTRLSGMVKNFERKVRND